MKKKIPFSLDYKEKIESGEVSVVTKDGNSVRIICWDANAGDRPIVGLVSIKGNYDQAYFYNEDGKLPIGDDGDDLYLLVEDELTEFETLVDGLMNGVRNGLVNSVSDEAAVLLEAARKALRPEFDEELEQACRNQDDAVFRKGYEAGFLAASEIDMEKLTDQIAEKVAAAILKGGNPFAPNPAIPYPGNPLPWTDPASPCEPITVMYGVTPVKFRATVANTPPSGDASAATTISDKED